MAKKASKTKSTDKEKSLQNAINQIEQAHGKGAIMWWGENPHVDVNVIPIGCISIDRALGVWGFPRGRVVEIYGSEASGKTTLALHALAEAQKGNGVAAIVDAEHALDPKYAKRLGVNLDELLISQPDSGEDALEIVETLVRSNAVDIVVVDSVAALVPRAEIEGEMGDSFVGLQARLMSQAMRKLTGAISKSNTCVVFINQTRSTIGMMGYGPQMTTTGGRALRFYASVRIETRQIAKLKERDNIIGIRCRVKVVKNKLAAPFREAVVDIIYGEGISKTGDLIDLGVEMKLIQKSGSWYSFDNEQLGQGKENSRAAIDANPELEQKIRTEILQKIKEKDGEIAPGYEDVIAEESSEDSEDTE